MFGEQTFAQLRTGLKHMPPVWQSPFCSPVRLKPYSTCSPVLHSLSVQSLSPTESPSHAWQTASSAKLWATHRLYQADSLSISSWFTTFTKLTHHLYQADISVVLLWMVQICWWCRDTYPLWLAASVTSSPSSPSWEQVSYLLPVNTIYCLGYKLLQW